MGRARLLLVVQHGQAVEKTFLQRLCRVARRNQNAVEVGKAGGEDTDTGRAGKGKIRIQGEQGRERRLWVQSKKQARPKEYY